MNEEDIGRKKMMIRTRMRLLRERLSQNKNLQAAIVEELKNKSNPIWRHPTALKKHSVIAGYYPINAEQDILPFLEWLGQNYSCRITLPVIEGYKSPLSFREYKVGDELVLHRNGKVLEPVKSKPILLPTTLFVPLLAFDSKGYRLGYGRGYYDRTLASLKDKGVNFVTIGVAYDKQKFTSDLPVFEHDVPLDFIVTESGVHSIKT